MKIKIHELAVQEFDEAIEWYELQSTGLGKRFKNAVVEQIKKVKKHTRLRRIIFTKLMFQNFHIRSFTQ
jgi:hypothetical protein